MESIGQYRVNPLTLQDGQIEMPLLDQAGRLSISLPSSGMSGSTTTDALISPTVKTVPTGTAEPVASSVTAITGVVVQAPSTNSITVYVGASGVTTSNGLEFLPGASKKFAVSDPALIYCIANNINQSLLILVE